MTAEQALAHYREHGTFYMDDNGYGELKELIEGMAAEIERLKEQVEMYRDALRRVSETHTPF